MKFKIFGLLPSEIYFFLLAYKQFIYYIKKSNILVYKNIELTMAVIATLSFIYSVDYQSQYRSFINIICIILVYSFTGRVLKSYDDIQYFLKNLLISSFYMIILIVYSYNNNIEIHKILDNSSITFFDSSDDVLLRASYFYTNFIYIFGIFGILVTTHKKNLIYYLFIITFLYCNYIVYNKTVLVALIISMIYIMLYYKYYKSIFIGLIIISSAYLFYISNNNLYNFSTGSIGARINVFSSIFNYFINNPLKLIIGNGPDSIIRSQSSEFVDILWGGNGYEGAIDSAYLSYLFDYGIFFLIAYIYYIYRNLNHMISIAKNSVFVEERDLAVLLFSIILFIAIIGFTQSLGTNKIVFIVAQLFALVDVLRKCATLNHGRRVY